MNNNRVILKVSYLALALILVCLSALVVLAGLILFRDSGTIQTSPELKAIKVISETSPVTTAEGEITVFPVTPVPIRDFDIQPTSAPTPTAIEIEQAPLDTLTKLENTIVPINDLLDLAERLSGITGIPRTVDPPLYPLEVGDRRTFWVRNIDMNLNFQVEAVLGYITDHAYFWIEDGVRYDEVSLQSLAKVFDNQIYPTNRAFFGSEWLPGVDGDPRVYILYARNLGRNWAGYFSSADEYHPLAHEYSNAVELFLLNADNVSLDNPLTYGVLAHELQHMIHWNQDRNESSWLNEGFSELAAFLNGYYGARFDQFYIRNPDLQLNDWPTEPDSTYPHYGASFLFVSYFFDRFGDRATRLLVSHPENGFSSVDAVLRELRIVDPLTGLPIQSDNVFMDWVLANYIQDTSVADGRFAYNINPDVPKPDETERFRNCPLSVQPRTVHQFGVDYIRFTCRGDYTLRFHGDDQVGVVPTEMHSGQKAFWSNKGDESDMTLTRRFDFRNLSGKITLDYWTWYDLEEDYDYLYLLASSDGIKWEFLDTPSGTGEDPSGNSYGWGYNGRSGGGIQAKWIQETVDLSAYAGLEIYIRFEYVTDAAYFGEGFLLDDIAVPEIGYFTDFEEDDGGWVTEGWARIENVMPQKFSLAMIYKGDTTFVEYFNLPESQIIEVPLRIGGSVDEAVLVVSGTNRFTRQQANYQFEVLP